MSNTQDNNLPNVNNSFSEPFQIEINDSTGLPASLLSRIPDAIRAAALSRGFTSGSIGLAVVDDRQIQSINLRHLGHDYPTDVISFCYQQNAPQIEGELVVSRDTAARQSTSLGWPLEHELMLYIVHGTLHICGLEDHTREDRQIMRSAEQSVLQKLGIAEAARFAPDGPGSSDLRDEQ